MRTIIKRLFGLFLFFSLSITSFAGETIYISTGEFLPFHGEQLENQGFANHVVSEAFQREGYKVQFEYFPWKRAYEMAKKGKYHGTAAWAYRVDREKDFIYGDSIYPSITVFIYHKDNPIPHWKELLSLHPYEIGATRGYTYTKNFWDLADSKRLKIQLVTRDLQNFTKLLKKRIDLFPIDIVTFKEILRTKFEPEDQKLFLVHDKPFFKTENSVIFPKSRKDTYKWVNIFNQGLLKLKTDGTHEKMWGDLLEGKYK